MKIDNYENNLFIFRDTSDYSSEALIGTDHYYYDDYENERSISDIAERSYMPALNAIGDMIRDNGKDFKVAFSLSGVGIEQLEMHAPQVLEKLQEPSSWKCMHHRCWRSCRN